MKLTIKQYSPQAAIKQVNLYDPCIYDKQLGFNKPAAVIADSLFVDSGICVLTVVCAICDIRSKSGFGTNTPQIADARPKTSTYQKLLFLRSDNAKLFDRKQPD